MTGDAQVQARSCDGSQRQVAPPGRSLGRRVEREGEFGGQAGEIRIGDQRPVQSEGERRQIE